jgi:3D (Asp-Asp-Asp) domain-containing protein
MRIISAFTALRIILAIILLPNVFLADVALGSNETQTNFKTQYSLLINRGIIGSGNDIVLANSPLNFEGFSQQKTAEELEREKVLAKYEARRKAAAYLLPQGKFTINASAYTAAADECGKSDGITASGLKVKTRETIACPSHFPFGTKLAIEGMGTYVCQDRGGAIKGNHIDIYMETKSEAFAFGRRNLLAQVVE